MTGRTASQEFRNIPAASSGKSNLTTVTLSWAEEVPMEIRLAMWEPSGECDGEDVQMITSISRDLLAEVTGEIEYDLTNNAVSDVTAVTVAGMSTTWLHLPHLSLTFPTEPLASFVRTTLAMCPIESEAVDVDGLIHQIFNAEEAS